MEFRDRKEKTSGALKKKEEKEMTEEEKTEMISEARIFALAAPIIMPIIERRKGDAIARLIQAHKAGITDTTALVAEVSVLSDLAQEINQKELIYQTLERVNARK